MMAMKGSSGVGSRSKSGSPDCEPRRPRDPKATYSFIGGRRDGGIRVKLRGGCCSYNNGPELRKLAIAGKMAATRAVAWPNATKMA